MILGTEGASDNLRRFGNILSSVSALKMSDSSGDLVVSIVGVCFLIVGGNGSGESRVSDKPSYPGNLNR